MAVVVVAVVVVAMAQLRGLVQRAPFLERRA
jgi:hypothetical protein